LQYTGLVPRREFRLVEARGERFRFYYEGDSDVLHITARHGITDEDAIATFFEATVTEWNEANSRFESSSETHILYWTRHAHDGSVIIISCSRREYGNA